MVFIAENKPLSEPFSFIILKKICSFALVITLILYTYNQFIQLSDSINAPNINFRKQKQNKLLIDEKKTKIILRACSPYPINCTYNDTNCKQDENRDYTTICSNANSFRYAFDYQSEAAKIEITPSINKVYLDGLVLNDDYYPLGGRSLQQLYSVNGQTIILYYSINIISFVASDYTFGLAGEKKFVDFNAHTDHITNLNTNTTTLILIPVSTEIYYQETAYYDINSVISNIGGFFSFLSGIFVFLFGATKLAPWGFLQTHIFNCLCVKYQRKLIRKLKNKYEPIPFVGGRIKNVTLEERVKSIENILKEYYLDTDFLNSLLIKYNKIDADKIDDKV